MKRHAEGYVPPVYNVQCTLYMLCTSFVPAASLRALSPSPEHSHKKCVLVFIILMYDYPPPSQNYSKVTVLFSDFDKQSLAVEFDGMVTS